MLFELLDLLGAAGGIGEALGGAASVAADLAVTGAVAAVDLAIMDAVIRIPGNALNEKFVSLGELKGKTYAEIEAVVGAPSSVSGMDEGKTLRQWMATGYHIALLFDKDDACLGITSQTSV